MPESTIENGLLALSGMDQDMARIRNGVGFNGRDTRFGNDLASQVKSGRALTVKQKAAAYRMLRTYRVQLGHYGIDYDAIPEPDAAPVEPGVTGSARVEGQTVVVTFTGFPKGLLNHVKAVPGARYFAESKEWIMPLDATTIAHVETWPDAIVLDPSFRDAIAEMRVKLANTADASRATEAELDLEIASRMYPFQRAGVVYAQEHERVLIADEMGLGKTIQALATIEAAEAYPALIVVPAVVKLNWQREANLWVGHRTVQVLTGRLPEGVVPSGEAEDITIVNYDVLKSWLPLLDKVGFRSVVFDESHYLKNPKAARTQAAKAVAANVGVRLCLTGTPILNRPVELAPQLDVLGRLRDFGGYWPFVKRYCGAYKGRWGWDLSGATNLPELHEKLRGTCMVRRTKDQVLSELPAKRQAHVPMALADPARYARVEAELKAWIKERLLANEEWLARIRTADPTTTDIQAETEAFERARRLGRAEALVKIEALKQVSAEEKLAAVIEWIRDFLESSDRKLVVFGIHRSIVGQIAEAFGAEAVSITGDTSLPDRQAAVDRFQGDPEIRLLVGNVQAAGVGITLTAASDVAFVELPWRPGDLTQAEDRCHRIGQTDSVTAWYLLANGTIENRIAGMIDAKREVVDAATDGVEGIDPAESIQSGIIDALEREDT